MAITLSNLKSPPKNKRQGKRLGRGNASGKGTFAGKGTKGQKARSGGGKGLKRIGMKMITQRIPKSRGFTSIHKRPYIVNLGALENNFGNNSTINPDALVKAGLVQNAKRGVKILGDGEVKKSFKIEGCLISKSAKEKIVKAGGTVI